MLAQSILLWPDASKILYQIKINQKLIKNQFIMVRNSIWYVSPMVKGEEGMQNWFGLWHKWLQHTSPSRAQVKEFFVVFAIPSKTSLDACMA